MVLATEFRKYAEDCRRMAAASTSCDDRQTWNHLAERWMRCAVNADKEAESRRDGSERASGDATAASGPGNRSDPAGGLTLQGVGLTP